MVARTSCELLELPFLSLQPSFLWHLAAGKVSDFRSRHPKIEARCPLLPLLSETVATPRQRPTSGCLKFVEVAGVTTTDLGFCLGVATSGDDPRSDQLNLAPAFWPGCVQNRAKMRGVGPCVRKPEILSRTRRSRAPTQKLKGNELPNWWAPTRRMGYPRHSRRRHQPKNCSFRSSTSRVYLYVSRYSSFFSGRLVLLLS